MRYRIVVRHYPDRTEFFPQAKVFGLFWMYFTGDLGQRICALSAPSLEEAQAFIDRDAAGRTASSVSVIPYEPHLRSHSL